MNRVRHIFGQILRYAISGNLVLSVLIASSAIADLNVDPGETYTVTGIETVGALNVEGTLIVESTGSLTFTSRSKVDGSDPGGHIIVNGGSIVGHARFDTNKTATITMNGGSFRVNSTFKFPDNQPGPVYMYLNGGILSAQDIQTMPDRNPHYIVGGGILRLDGNVEGHGQQYDPREWINLGIMVSAEGYEEIIVEYVAQGDYTEVSAVSSITEVQFASSTSEGSESFSHVNIPVSLSEPVGMTVTVNYAVVGGSADGDGIDYILDAGSLQFDPLIETQSISIALIDDGLEETPDETIVIDLSDPSGNAKLGSFTTHTLTILPGVSSPCPKGDLDGDCRITVLDLQILGMQWLDEQGACSRADPDCANLDGLMGVNMDDFVKLSRNWLEVGTTVVINEVMASNGTTISDPQEPDEQPDWFEIYNTGVDTVELGGMYITDDNDFPTKWLIPDSISIAPGKFKLFWADGDDEQGDYHTNFNLDTGGDDISLYASDGMTLIDTIDFRDYSQTTDISYGHYPDGSGDLRYLSSPTPGSANSGAYTGVVADTKFSHDRGFYDAGFDLIITCDPPGATIKYTIDGTEPSRTHGSTYSGSLRIGSTTCIRAMAYKDGWLSTNVDTHTYIFGASVQDKALPILSLVKGVDYGRTSVEVLYADPNMGEGFQADCELTPHSSTSYRLKFKAEFGTATLNYPFFEAAPVNAESATDRFDRIIVRRGKNRPTTWMSDPWVANTQVEMCGVGAHSMFMHLYINGSYDSLVNPKERPDAWFTSSYFGGDFDDYFATNHGIERCGDDRPNSPCHLSGDNTRFGQVYDMAYAQNLEDPSNYAQFKQLCDVSNFADYTILFWYSGFGDGIDNNWYGGMRNVPLNGEVPPEGFMMFMWDAEASFQPAFTGPAGNEVPWVPSYYGSGDQVIPTLWRSLRENDDFMNLFADRVYKHLYNDGVITDENAQDRWDVLEGAIIAGGYTPYEALDMSGFRSIFINALREEGYYPDIDPPVFNQHGGQVPVGFNLTIANPNGSGTIYYTLNGSDPRQQVTGDPVGTAGSAVTLNYSSHVKARVYDNSNWSALHEAIFGVGPVRESLRITEIMYHPTDPTASEISALDPDPMDEDFEFIEVKNIGPSPVNLNLVQFTDGIDFTFGDFTLAADDYAVIVRNYDSFAERYNTAGINIVPGTNGGCLRGFS